MLVARFGCSLFVVCGLRNDAGCSFVVVCCMLFVVCYVLIVAYWLLVVVRCLMFVVCCVLCGVRCWLCIVSCLLFVVCWLLLVVGGCMFLCVHMRYLLFLVCSELLDTCC